MDMDWQILVLIALVLYIGGKRSREKTLARWSEIAMEDRTKRKEIPGWAYVLMKLYELEDDVVLARMRVREIIELRRHQTHPGCSPKEYLRLVAEESRRRATLSLATMALQDHARRTGLDPWQERVDIPEQWSKAWNS